MCQIGVLIYIQPHLLIQQQHDLEEQLENLDGVSLAIFAAGRQHFLTVEYDPEKLNSSRVLQQVEGCGIEASYYNY